MPQADPVAKGNDKRNNIQMCTQIPDSRAQREGTKLPDIHILSLSCRTGSATTGCTGRRPLRKRPLAKTTPYVLDAAFLLTVGSFLLTAEELPAYSLSFFTYHSSIFAYSWASLLTQWESVSKKHLNGLSAKTYAGSGLLQGPFSENNLFPLL